MGILRWMCSKVLRDRIRNENICGMVGVAPIVDKVRENRLRWFRHVYHRSRLIGLVWRSDMDKIEG